MNTQIINTEITYTKLFSQSIEEDRMVRFWDDEIPDMYTHNFTLVKNRDIDIQEIILLELTLRKESGMDFLRVEMNFDIDQEIIDELPIKPEVTVYDYMYIHTDRFATIVGNSDSSIKKATSDKVILDGKNVDVLVNKDAIGLDFAKRRIDRKAEIYALPSQPLDMYVCYHEDIPIGKCELLVFQDIAKIEEFDILHAYQRKGFGSAVIKHLLQIAKNRNVDHAYLITDSSDTAKGMYRKCGFEKIGVKTELQFFLK